MKTIKKTKDQFAMVRSKADGMEKMLDKFQVTNDEELGIVSDKVRAVRTLKRFIEQEKDKFVDPAKAIIAEAKEKYDPYIKKCKNAEEVLKQRAKIFMEEKEDKRKEEEARIAARVERGTLKAETAIRKLETLPDNPKTVRTDQGSGLRMIKRRVPKFDVNGQRGYIMALFEETPASMKSKVLPQEYWVIDEVKVRRDALERDKSGLPQIPGVTIEEKSSLGSVSN